jgi:hypothetical protein
MYSPRELNDEFGDVKQIVAVTAIVKVKEVGIIEFGPGSRLADQLFDRVAADLARFPFVKAAATMVDFFGKERVALAFPDEFAGEAVETAEAEPGEQSEHEGGGEAAEVTGPQNSKAYAVVVDSVVTHWLLVTDNVVVADEVSEATATRGFYVIGFSDEELQDGADALPPALRIACAGDYLYRFSEGGNADDPQRALDVFDPSDAVHDQEFEFQGVTYSVISFDYEG